MTSAPQVSIDMVTWGRDSCGIQVKTWWSPATYQSDIWYIGLQKQHYINETWWQNEIQFDAVKETTDVVNSTIHTPNDITRNELYQSLPHEICPRSMAIKASISTPGIPAKGLLRTGQRERSNHLSNHLFWVTGDYWDLQKLVWDKFCSSMPFTVFTILMSGRWQQLILGNKNLMLSNARCPKPIMKRFKRTKGPHTLHARKCKHLADSKFGNLDCFRVAIWGFPEIEVPSNHPF